VTTLSRHLLTATALSFLGGCMVGPDHRTPEPILSKRWHAAGTSAQPPGSMDEAMLMSWWKTFDDPLLTRLIEEARQQNPDLRMSFERITQARSEQNANRADLYPRVSATGAAARVSNLFPVQVPTGKAFDYFLTGFDAVWEIDLFGRLRRRLEAAEAQTSASVEQYRQAFVLLAAEIGRQYVQYREMQESHRITETILGLLHEKEILTEVRVNNGLSTRDEMDRIRAQALAIRAESTRQTAELVSGRHRLELLLGRQPDTLQTTLGSPGTVPTSGERRMLMQPASILRHRPDIRGAEQKLAGATAMQGAALAEMFPKISVVAFLGLHNSDLENLFRSSAFAWASAASISQPLFNFGKIRAGINLADAQQREATFNYEKTVLSALHECESALSDVIKEEQRKQELQQSLTHLQTASQLARQRLEGGLGTRQAEIDTILETRGAELGLLQSRATLATRLIGLYKALGGGGKTPVKLEEDPLRPWG